MLADVFVPERLYGIIGYPLGHSLSPKLHNWAFTRHNLSCVYMKWPLRPSSIAAFMLSLRTLPIYGLSITIPHKQNVIPYLDGLTDQVLQTRAVNTLFWSGNLLYGDNTDCKGFVAPITEQNFESALILGAGGACRACIAGLKNIGVSKIRITARNDENARRVAKDMSVQSLPWSERALLQADLLINATPLGMAGKWDQESAYSHPEQLKGFNTVYDLIYNPLETRLLQQAKEAGCRPVYGLEMFLHQAAEQFKLWTGEEFALEQARKLLQKDLPA